MTALQLQAHPFYDAADLAPVSVQMPPGLTVSQMLDRIISAEDRSESLVVTVKRGQHSHELPERLWSQVRPRDGSEILVTRMPEGGGTWRSVAMIAVSALAIWFTGGAAAGLLGSGFAAGTFGAAALGVGVTMVGSLLVNAAFPPPSGGGQQDSKQWNQLTGTSNQINPGGPIPCTLGQVRYFPPHAAIPYSQSVGEDSYQYCLFDLGHDVDADDVSDIRIGDNPLSNFEGITYNITKTPTLYTSDVSEAAVGAALVVDTPVVRTSGPGSDEVSFDIIFPGGLYRKDSKGKTKTHGVSFLIERRAAGTGSYVPVVIPRLSGLVAAGAGVYNALASKEVPFAVGGAFDSGGAAIDLRITRIPSTVPPGGGNTYIDGPVWSVIRTLKAVSPSTTGTTKLEMRIKANGQLNGTLQTLSLTQFRKVPVYSTVSETWTRTRTARTAWVALDLMRTSSAVSKHVPDSRIALNTWIDYAYFCGANALNTRAVVDTRLTMGELLRDTLAGSLGRLSEVQGKYSVMFDAGDKIASDALTTLESGNLQWSRAFIRRPHALRVQFRNPDADWQQDEIMVLDDGYSYRGVDARGNPSSLPEPSIFETLDLRMVADAKQAWKLGRLQFGQARYQSATASFETDIAGMRYYRGDVIRLENDVMEWGAGSGWVSRVDGNTITLDAEIETDPAKTYKAQVRRIATNGAQSLDVFDIEPHSAITATFYLTAGHTAAVGDAVILSAVGHEAPEMILTHRATGNDKQFSFQAVAYDPRVAGYWANPPAVIVSEVTGQRYTEAPDPPVIIAVAPGTNVDDAGILTPKISIGIKERSGFMKPDYQVLER